MTLGRIAGVYGVQGWLRIHSETRPQENLLKYRSWLIKSPQAEFQAKLLQGRMHSGAVIAQISGPDGAAITDRDAAAALNGAQIQVERSTLPKLKKGQYYWVDLIGLQVQNEQGAALGTVTDMTSNNVQDVLVVKDGGTERLIPFVNGAVVKSVDLKARRIVCDWQPDW
ncbi:MAG TPA: ribosome maturation factor RimM [Nevskiaceae bacterium]|nr:ribosome maturation factor RimM [Nevskiaceae bacterium]